MSVLRDIDVFGF